MQIHQMKLKNCCWQLLKRTEKVIFLAWLLKASPSFSYFFELGCPAFDQPGFAQGMGSRIKQFVSSKL